MTDYKKAEQAKKLLIESGLPIILAYGKDDKHFGSGVHGEYQTLKIYIIDAMWRLLKEVSSKYGDRTAADETLAIASAVIERLYNDKKQFEKRFEE